jgi:thymidylate synthase (FAD)
MDQIHNNFIDEAIDDFGLVLASKAQVWYNGCMKAERAYMNLIALKCSPQEARSVLPNSLKTEVVMTANLREWKHVVELRSSKAAHPQIREVMIPLKEMFIGWLPEVFYEPHC